VEFCDVRVVQSALGFSAIVSKSDGERPAPKRRSRHAGVGQRDLPGSSTNGVTSRLPALRQRPRRSIAGEDALGGLVVAASCRKYVERWFTL
jgi:hypothetical protein